MPLLTFNAGIKAHGCCAADQKRAFAGGIICDKGTRISPHRRSTAINHLLDWGKTSVEDVLKEGNTSLYTYSAYKTLSEQAAWKFAEEHPELDLATSKLT